MKPRFYLALLLWFGLAGRLAWGQVFSPIAPPAAGVLVITNVNVVDVETGQIAPDCTVVMRDGTVLWVSQWVPAGRAGPRLDGRGRYFVPGL